MWLVRYQGATGGPYWCLESEKPEKKNFSTVKIEKMIRLNPKEDWGLPIEKLLWKYAPGEEVWRKFPIPD